MKCKKLYYNKITKKETRCKGWIKPEYDWCPRCLDREYQAELDKRYFPCNWNKDLILDLKA